MMKIAVKPDIKSKTFSNSKGFTLRTEKESSLFGFQFYQKLFVVLISLSTILIFPESPRQLEDICETYNSKKICNVL